MKRILPILVLAVAWLAAPRAFAQSFPVDCVVKDTLGMMDCLEAREKAEDKLLQHAYDTLVATLKERQPERVHNLILAERAWLKFIDAQCKFDSSISTPGDQAGVAQSFCMITQTADRRMHIENALKNLVGGSAFP